jgi:hypothetical protein
MRKIILSVCCSALLVDSFSHPIVATEWKTTGGKLRDKKGIVTSLQFFNGMQNITMEKSSELY